MRKFLSIVVLVMFLLSAQTADAAIRWRMVANGTPGTILYNVTQDFARYVYVLSQGELQIEVFGLGVMFPPFETFDAVTNNVIQAHNLFGLYWPGRDPNFALLSRAGCPITTFSQATYLEKLLFDWQNSLYNPFGQTYVGTMMVVTVYEQLMSTVPIRTVDDLQGLRVRSSGLGARFFDELGATTVSLPLTEILPALQTGALEAAEWTVWEENMRLGFHEVVSYVLDPSLHCGILEYLPLIVNTAAWEALPEHLRNVVDAARQMVAFQTSLLYVEELRAKRQWAALPHIEIIYWDEECVRRAREVGLRLMRELGEASEQGMEFLRIYSGFLWDQGYEAEAKALGFEPNN